MEINPTIHVSTVTLFYMYLKIHLNVMEYMQGRNEGGTTGPELLRLDSNELNVTLTAK
jgi:hypothetical protein